MRACLDTPTVNQTCDLNGCLLEGWAVGSSELLQLASVEVWINGRCAGATRHWHAREDVTAALALPRSITPGFAIGLFPGSLPPKPTRTQLELRFFDDTRQVGILERTIEFVAYGDPRPPTPRVVQRHPSHDSLCRIITRMLSDTRQRIVEFNCGRGDVGYSLCKYGIHWHGIEGRSDGCEFLAARGLPFTRPRGFTTSYRDHGFAYALGFDTTPQDLLEWLPELRRLTAQGIMLSGKISGDSSREDLERLVSRHFARFESLPYVSDTADPRPSAVLTFDRWFLFAQGWS
ncbi:MAG: hypothetical protein K1X42_04075 [Opitutaceae bacterium]|nr:hypothetical protein [Opitutaceae bacterium]